LAAEILYGSRAQTGASVLAGRGGKLFTGFGISAAKPRLSNSFLAMLGARLRDKDGWPDHLCDGGSARFFEGKKIWPGGWLSFRSERR